MIALAKRRRLGMTGVLLLVVSLVTVVGLPALAHDGIVTADCNGLHVELTLFNTRGDNEVTVTVDGSVVAHVADFGAGYTLDHPWDPNLDHTYTVVALAWDDPDSTKGFSKFFEGSVTACPVSTTGSTTSTTEGTTTTTAGDTTTTTEAATTTTGATTTTTAATTTTSETEVLGIQVSAPQTPQVATQQTLPFTGMSSGSLAMLASAIAGVGLLLLLASRQTQEKSPVRSWR